MSGRFVGRTMDGRSMLDRGVEVVEDARLRKKKKSRAVKFGKRLVLGGIKRMKLGEVLRQKAATDTARASLTRAQQLALARRSRQMEALARDRLAKATRAASRMQQRAFDLQNIAARRVHTATALRNARTDTLLESLLQRQRVKKRVEDLRLRAGDDVRLARQVAGARALQAQTNATGNRMQLFLAQQRMRAFRRELALRRLEGLAAGQAATNDRRGSLRSGNVSSGPANALRARLGPALRQSNFL